MDNDVKYSRYISISDGFCPNMSREAINKSPEEWLSFYPHVDFLRLLDDLLEAFDGKTKTIWITGNYGTGKSNAALVIQKLFLDDKTRVDKWFDKFQREFQGEFQSVPEKLTARRDEGTLVVYDYNVGGTGPDKELLIRLEKSVIKALEDEGMKIPPASASNQIIDRVLKDGAPSFETINRIGSRLHDVTLGIKNDGDLIKLLKTFDKPEDINYTYIIEDLETVLRERDIYLGLDVSSFKKWINNVLRDNNLKRVVYIFDEFSTFIENNKVQLKTFEEVSENPQESNFFFIPITHVDLTAFVAENSESAQRCKDRFVFRRLTMPETVAFELMAHAINENVRIDLADELRGHRNNLWASVKDIADTLNVNKEERFSTALFEILPVHPMAGYMLKVLSQYVGSNQRSIFEYLKDESKGSFSDFIKEGGPYTPGKQMLTVDYLWEYFVMRDIPGDNNAVRHIRIQYSQSRESPLLRDKTNDSADVRVLKIILLLILFKRISIDGNAFLQPTMDNLRLAIPNDIGTLEPIVDDLESAGCISKSSDGVIDLYSTFASDQDFKNKVDEYLERFDLVCETTEKHLTSVVKTNLGNFPENRFQIKVTDVGRVGGSTFSQHFHDDFSSQASNYKDNGKICLWFVISKDRKSSLQVNEKILKTLEKIGNDELRVVFFSFDDVTFCSDNKDEWQNYAEACARCDLANQTGKADELARQRDSIADRWNQKLTGAKGITAYYWNNEKVTDHTEWKTLYSFVKDRVDQFLEYNLDTLVDSPGSAKNPSNFGQWAKAGIGDSEVSEQYRKVVRQLDEKGVSYDSDWFDHNPDSQLSAVRDVVFRHLDEDLRFQSRFDLDSAYSELRRSPYGMQDIGMSGFVLGFCTKELIDGDYQWTDEKTSGELDIKTLAEIIDQTIRVHNDGRSHSRKFICRPSESERAFFKDAPGLFGSSESGCNQSETIKIISESFEERTNKVPVWIVSDYISKSSDPDSSEIVRVLDEFPTIMGTSSKGETKERTEAICRVGEMLLDDPELPGKVSKYFNKKTCSDAFGAYIKENHPDIVESAEKVGDFNENYLDQILKIMASSASYLWNKTDISQCVSEVLAKYEIIEVVEDLLSTNDFIPFEYSVSSLCDHMEKACVPLELIVERYPSLHKLYDRVKQLQRSEPAEIIRDTGTLLTQNKDSIRKLFFSNDRKELLKIAQANVAAGGLSDNEYASILDGVHQPFIMDAREFKSQLNAAIDRFNESSLRKEVQTAWCTAAGTSSMQKWESDNKMPARYAFRDTGISSNFDAVVHPENYNTSKLEELKTLLQQQGPPDIAECQEAFLRDTVPPRYDPLGITFAQLVEYLSDNYGEPGKWEGADIQDLVCTVYKNQLHSVLAERVNSLDSDRLKKIVLETISDNIELGIELMRTIK